MKAYQVLVYGTNFLVEFGAGLEKHGFYTNVYVQAVDEEQAEYAAMELLRRDEGLRGWVHNDKDDPPIMYAEDIQEIDDYEEIEHKLQGLSWYPENEGGGE